MTGKGSGPLKSSRQLLGSAKELIEQDLHNEATVLERVCIRRNNISVRVFTPANIKRPEECSDIYEHRAFRQIHTDTFATAIAKACMTL